MGRVRKRLLWLALIMPAAIAPWAASLALAASPRPAEQYAALPFIVGPILSPNGTKIAAKVGNHGKQYLAVVLLDRSKDRIRTFEIGELDVRFWRWVNDDWLIASVGDEQDFQADKIYVTRLLALKADGSVIKKIGWSMAGGQWADKVIWIANDGTPRIRFALQESIYSGPDFWPKVVEADVSTGRIRNVVDSHVDIWDWYADATGAVRVGVGATGDGRLQRMLYRPNDKGTFHVVDRANTRRDEDLLQPTMFLPDSNKAVAIADDKDGYRAVFELDLTTMTLGRQLIGAPGYDIDDIVADERQTSVLGATVVEKGPKTHWLDPALAALQADLDKAVKGQRATVVSWSRDFSRLLLLVGFADSPGSYYLFDRALGAMRRFAYVDEGVKGARGHPVRTITYKARDGLEIAAVLTLPAARPAQNLPTIVMPHGGPFARDDESWDWIAQFLADRGYAVIQPNYRGSSGYGTAFAKRGEGQWGLAMQDDLNDAVAHLAREGIADPKRVCMIGTSYGGYAAMRAAQRDGALYRCAISYAGVSDLARMRSYDSRFLWSGAGADWLNKQAPDFRAVSPLFHAEEFTIPILMIHGKVDRRVPVAQSRLMADRLKNAGKPVTYVEQPLGDHHFSRTEDRLDFLTRMEAFLKAHNPA